ncbi:hypothetical protein [Mesorhizobium sp. f-mel]
MGGVNLACTDDDAAKEHANRLADGHEVELGAWLRSSPWIHGERRERANATGKSEIQRYHTKALPRPPMEVAMKFSDDLMRDSTVAQKYDEASQRGSRFSERG